MRVAAIDCGTNSIRLLIAEKDAAGRLVELDRRLEVVRLGQGIDASGEFHPDALQRTFAAVDDYAKLIKEFDVHLGRVQFVATSASRDARNREDFYAGVEKRLGVFPDVISGDEEARLSFAGATSGLNGALDPILVMDIGGGSTELIYGLHTGEIDRAISLDIGSVRMTERFFKSDPPSKVDLEAASHHIDMLLDGSKIDFARVKTWIGVAGTVTSLGAIHLQLRHYDRKRVHGSKINSAAVADLLSRLSKLTADEIRQIPSMHPKRADVITAGTLIAARVAERVGARELTVSESDILDGIANRLLQT